MVRLANTCSKLGSEPHQRVLLEQCLRTQNTYLGIVKDTRQRDQLIGMKDYPVGRSAAISDRYDEEAMGGRKRERKNEGKPSQTQ